MTVSDAFASTFERFGDAERTFGCCDTDFVVRATGLRADSAADRARRVARSLEARLNAFDSESVVARLNREGVVEDVHVARLVRRGLEYADRTGGVFDVRQGRLEHDLKSYLRGDRRSPPETFDAREVSVEGDRVRADATVDLNGLAKGYIVDRAADALGGFVRSGFVSGGGDMSPPTGPVAVESPYGDASPLKVLDTTWNVATSGGYRRTRSGVDHIYDPTAGRLGSRHDSVTVVARRDCMEADALATTLAALPTEAALGLVAQWPDAEAFLVHGGVFHATDGFDSHVTHH